MTTRAKITKEIEHLPYTYLIGWSKQNLWYYGVRYACNCYPGDLWVTYFTSSKYVTECRSKYGEPDVIQIRKTFNNQQAAVLWETKTLRRLNVLKSDKWINRNIAGKMTGNSGDLNGMFGKKHSLESIEKMKQNKKSTVGRNNSMFGKKHNPETLDKIGSAAKGKRHGAYNGMFGKTHTDEVKASLSISNKGRNNNQFEGYFITPWGKFESAVDAAINYQFDITAWTINRWCKKDNLTIIRKTSRPKLIQINNIGKTYNDIGFGFERIEQ
jgi:hypothetical protein